MKMGKRRQGGSSAMAGCCLAMAAFARNRLVSATSIRLTECPADAPEATYSWSSAGDYLYVEGEGSCVTLPDIYAGVDNPPLTYHTTDGEESDTETGIWLMTKNIYMESGTTLLLHGDLGCTELRIASSSTNALHLRAGGSYISILNTKVTSWSISKSAPDEGSYDGSNPRSYISAVSEMTHPSDTCDGAADEDIGEGRLDIINSDVGYLGYQAAEAYGLSWKVKGFCTDLSNPEVFDRVNVRGDIRFSDIHHNWFGQYSYGHQDGLWEHNFMHDCGQYGFDPHDDSDNLRIHDNTVYDNGNHGIIASKRCNDVSIQNNIVTGNTLHGIMLHRSSDNGIIRNNTVTSSGSACIAIFESFGIEISDNVCTDNEEGIRLSMGSSYNKIFDNTVTNTVGRAIWLYLGSDEVEASAATEGRCTGNVFQNNYLDTAENGVLMRETNDNIMIGNTFVNTPENEWEDSDGLLWKDNVIDSDFGMDFTTTCVTSESDLTQIDDAGGSTSEC